MRLSTRGRYALEAVLILSLQPDKQMISLGRISKQTGLSRQYLEQIFATMKQAGLVYGARGSRGGYRLTVDPAELTAGDVLRAVEGNLSPVRCLLSAEAAHQGGAGQCSRMQDCRTRPLWAGLEQAITQVLDQTTLADLADKYREGEWSSS